MLNKIKANLLHVFIGCVDMKRSILMNRFFQWIGLPVITIGVLLVSFAGADAMMGDGGMGGGGMGGGRSMGRGR
jgi:hypothetical protein